MWSCDADTDGYANSNANSYPDANTDRDSYTESNPDSHANTYTDSYTNSDPYAYTYSDADTNSDAYANANAHTYTNSDTDTHAYSDSNTYSDANSNTDSNAYSDSYAVLLCGNTGLLAEPSGCMVRRNNQAGLRGLYQGPSHHVYATVHQQGHDLRDGGAVNRGEA